MELNVLESTKTRLKFEIQGEGHTFCNALRKELWQGKNVEIAGYSIEHSLVTEPVFVIETDKGDPKKLLLEAAERLQKKNKEFITNFKNGSFAVEANNNDNSLFRILIFPLFKIWAASFPSFKKLMPFAVFTSV